MIINVDTTVPGVISSDNLKRLVLAGSLAKRVANSFGEIDAEFDTQFCIRGTTVICEVKVFLNKSDQVRATREFFVESAQCVTDGNKTYGPDLQFGDFVDGFIEMLRNDCFLEPVVTT